MSILQRQTKTFLIAAVAACFMPVAALAGISVNPTGVNVNSADGNTILLRFSDDTGTPFTSNLGIWCGRLLPNGSCDPSTIFGRLPARLDRGSTATPTNSITDFMAIPYEVVRRALISARAGTSADDNADFFYVRQFQQNGQQIFVSVTCRMTAGTARTPLALTQVQLYLSLIHI